jgi:hypothetical protein
MPFRICTPILFLVCAGCVRYEESIVVDASGKGTATIVASYPERGRIEKFAIGAGSLDDVFSQKTMNKDLPPGVTLSHSTTVRDERVEVNALYAFDDIVKLTTWAARRDTRSPLSNISVLRKADAFEFTRDFKTFDAEQIKEIRKHCVDCTIMFKLTGPGKLTTHNATRVEGETAIWELKAPTLFAEGGQTFKAAYYYGSSWTVIIIIIFGAILTAVLAWKYLCRKSLAVPPAPIQ